MGCFIGSDGHGGEALYFNFNQLSGKLFLVQVNPDTGAARQFNAPQGPGAWRKSPVPMAPSISAPRTAPWCSSSIPEIQTWAFRW